MKGVSLEEAIGDGAWYECIGKYFKEQIDFRLRVLSFTATTVKKIDRKLKVDVEGILWLMGVEVISMCKQPISPYNVRYVIELLDQDGFTFNAFSSDLDRNKPSGMHRFSGWSDAFPLSPKVMARGSIAFVLPDEVATYRLVVGDTEIRRIDTPSNKVALALPTVQATTNQLLTTLHDSADLRSLISTNIARIQELKSGILQPEINSNSSLPSYATLPQFLRDLIKIEVISLVELRKHLLPLDLLPSAVIEQVNDKAFDLAGEPALEEDEEKVIVFREVLTRVLETWDAPSA